MGLRAELDAPSRISRDLWTVTVDAAMARGHMTVVANLLGSELVPAVAEAMAALGHAVTLASTPPIERPASWSVEALPRLDRVTCLLKRACDVLAVAERREQLLLGGPPPLPRELGSVARVLDKVLADLALELEGRDAWPEVAGRLGQSLCGLVDPVSALVERMDADDLDGVELVPLKQAMLSAYEDLCEALLFALGRLDLASERPRARATA
jgi:hypothetical protein